MSATTNAVKVGIIGASGYTGAELLRLLARHERVQLMALTADRKAGQAVGDVFPHLGGLSLPALTAIDDVDYGALDVVFCGLPHGTTQEVIRDLPAHLKVFDLSADFRLDDVEIYAQWYGHPHFAPALQEEAVYGLTELNRDSVKKARLVACPGCYPTAALLPLAPLLAAGAIAAEDIIVDAKSGVTGAGRSLREEMLFAEVGEGVHAYGIAGHRHGPEMEQELSKAAGREVAITFTPHLVPMNRGILTTMYVALAGDTTLAAARQVLAERYAGEPFVRVLGEGQAPATRHVRGSNHCLIGVFADRRPGRAILVSAIDNLVKGASGQAVQNMNLACGFAETTALEQQPLFP
jgi:N-acetyl-gamma-glutamyl-phosphate reductase